MNNWHFLIFIFIFALLLSGMVYRVVDSRRVHKSLHEKTCFQAKDESEEPAIYTFGKMQNFTVKIKSEKTIEVYDLVTKYKVVECL